MAIISSHILDSIAGDHARGIRVVCTRVSEDQSRLTVFDSVADNDGRISQNIDIDGHSADTRYELEFYSADYFASMNLSVDGGQILDTVVVRISLPEPSIKYHLPLVLSPHSYTLWWSGVAPNPDV